MSPQLRGSELGPLYRDGPRFLGGAESYDKPSRSCTSQQ